MNRNFKNNHNNANKGEAALIPDKLRSADGIILLISSENKEHLKAHPDVIRFLEKAASKITLGGKRGKFEMVADFNETIGISGLIATESVSPDQKTSFALRKGRKFPSRVVAGINGNPCDSVTMEILFDEDFREHKLITAYIGFPCPDEPFYIQDRSSEEYKAAISFWSDHALAYDPVTMGPIFESSWNEILK